MDIIDRVEMRDELGDMLDSFSDKQAHIIVAPSGFGKSLVTELILKGHSTFPALKVERRSDGHYQAGDYITEIARQACHPFNQVPFPFDFTQCVEELIDQQRAIGIAEKMPSILSFIGGTAAVLFNSQKRKSHIESLLSDGFDSEDVAICKLVLRRVLPSSPFILNIENVQSIDDYSLSQLPDILRECESFFLLLEFTPGQQMSIDDVVRKLIKQSMCSTQIVKKMEKLDKCEIISYAKQRGMQDIGWLENELANWDGNVRNIVDGFFLHEDAGCAMLQSGTKERIDALDPKQLQALQLISLDFEPVARRSLAIMGYADEVEALLNERQSLVKEAEGYVSVSHDSIVTGALSCNEQNALMAKQWLDYYETANDIAPRVASLKKLHYSVLIGEARGLVSIMEEIKPIICGSADPFPTIDAVKRIYLAHRARGKEGRELNELLIWLIDLYQSVHDYKTARELLEFLPPENPNHDPLEALLDYRCHHYKTARDKSKRLLSKQLSDHEALFYTLIHLEACYELDDDNGCDQDFDFLESNESRFSRFAEYGFFYRNAELVKSYRQCIEYQTKGIEHFKRFGASKQEISTRLTRGVHYALIGDFESAMSDFVWAEKHRGEFVGLLHECLNNQAVVQMYSGDYDGVAEKLERARLLPMTPFDRLVIGISLLGYCTHQEIANPVLAGELEEMLASANYYGPVIRQYTHIALFKHYSLLGEDDLAQKHLDNSYNITEMKPYVEYWITGERTAIDDIHYFRDSFDQPLSFISEWGIEFDYRLMQFR